MLQRLLFVGCWRYPDKGTGGSGFTVNVGITADGALTINGGGSGTISMRTIGTAGGFTFGGENMSTGGTFQRIP